MKSTLSSDQMQAAGGTLWEELTEFNARFPGDSANRQPVHTVYGGAHVFRSDTAVKLGALALQSLEEYAPDPFIFARAIGLTGADRLPETMAAAGLVRDEFVKDAEAVRRINEPAWLAETVYRRVVDKLRREPVEDFRLDFEDGYGNRPDDEEDEHAGSAAQEMAAGMKSGTLPPFVGIRVKPFTQELMRRSMRTMDIFISTLFDAAGALPPWFVVTLPKVQLPSQVTLLADLFDVIEAKLGLAGGSLKLEFMIETTQSVLNGRGTSNLPLFLEAARGRAMAAHFGTYDYTASCNITAAHQRMDHPACDFARHMMQVAYAGTGLWLSDGATNIMPIAPHRPDAGRSLAKAEVVENHAVVHRAWHLHAAHIRHSLVNAFYQGWDLHPAQLPTRYAAVYSFFIEGLAAATDRLHNFIRKAGQATLIGDVFDDAATGQGLLNYFLRALNCGAITEEEALATGLTLDELRSRSFAKIMKGRRDAEGPVP